MEKTKKDSATTGGGDMNDFGQDLQEWTLEYNQPLSFGSDLISSNRAYQSSKCWTIGSNMYLSRSAKLVSGISMSCTLFSPAMIWYIISTSSLHIILSILISSNGASQDWYISWIRILLAAAWLLSMRPRRRRLGPPLLFRTFSTFGTHARSRDLGSREAASQRSNFNHLITDESVNWKAPPFDLTQLTTQSPLHSYTTKILVN